jgi:hypothetical protein
MATTTNGHKQQRQRLLRHPRGEENGLGGGHPQGVPQARAQISSRRESWGQVSRGEVQDSSPRPTTFSAIPRSARSTTSSASTRTTSTPRQPRLTRAAAALAQADSADRGKRRWRRNATHTQEVPFDFSGFDFNDYSEGAGAAGRRAGDGGGFRDIFSNIFGGGGRGEACSMPEPGTDLEYQVNVGFWQAIKGAEMQLTIPRLEVCTKLPRPGLHRKSWAMSGMQGQRTGHAEKRQHEVQRAVHALRRQRQEPHRLPRVPRRRTHRAQRVAEGTHQAGNARRTTHPPGGPRQCRHHGCAAGDLYIIVRVGEHPVFKREGDDIHLTVPVTLSEAALGAKVEVPTIDGRALLRIPPGTQCGQKLRLREKGVPSAATEGQRGDEIVEIQRSLRRLATSARRRSCASWRS